MSVLIKGVEMPKSCDNCPCYYETEGAWRNECQVLQEECAISEGRPSWCPLIEIPPHGRLIDADALCDGLVSNHPVVIHANSAPTIIEAEED